MARRDDFNAKAMEEKIAKNAKRGLTKTQILIALKDEQLTVYRQMQTLEARAVELSDQIDYIEECHVKPDNIRSRASE